MTTLIEAKREAETARSAMMRAYELYLDSRAVFLECSTEYARTVAASDMARAKLAWEEAREKARDAGRRFSDLRAGLGAMH